jgi:hypothetical protein
VQAFLVDVFDANSVHQQNAVQARSLTAKALLDRGSQRLIEQNAVPESVSASLFRLFGSLYENLNERELASRMHKKSLEAAERAHGKASKEYAQALLEFAWAEGNQRLGSRLPQIVEARTLLEKRAPRGELHAQALVYEAHNSIVSNPSRTLEAATEAQRILDGAGSETKKLRAIATRAEAHAYRMRSSHELAIQKYRAAADLFAQLYGRDNIEVAEAKGGVASILNSMLRLKEADAELQDVLAITRAFDGVFADAKAYGRAASLVAADLGRSENALKSLLATHSAILDRSGKSTSFAFAVSLEAANVAAARGDFAQALPLALRSKREYEEGEGSSPQTLSALSLLEARMRTGLSQYAEANAALAEAKRLTVANSSGPFSSKEIAAAEIDLLLRKGDVAAAKQLLAEQSAGITRESLSVRETLAHDFLRMRLQEVEESWEDLVTTGKAWIDLNGDRVQMPQHTLAEMYLMIANAEFRLGKSGARNWLARATQMIETNDAASSERRTKLQALRALIG